MANELLARITSSKRGTIHMVAFRTDLGKGVYKETRGLYRVGVNYSKITNVIAKGLGGGSLKGDDKWLDFPFTIGNEKGVKIRLTNTYNPFAPHSTKYYHDGHEVTKEYLIENKLVAPSRLKSRSGVLDVFNVFADNIIDFK